MRALFLLAVVLFVFMWVPVVLLFLNNKKKAAIIIGIINILITSGLIIASQYIEV